MMTAKELISFVDEVPAINIKEVDIRDFIMFDPGTKCFLRISEGDGMNLLDEDIEAGYVDYLYWNEYEMNEHGELENTDGGMWLLEELYVDLFSIDNIDDIFRNYDFGRFGFGEQHGLPPFFISTEWFDKLQYFCTNS